MFVSKKMLFGIFSLLFISGVYFPGNGFAANNDSVKKTPWVMDIPASQKQWDSESTRARIVIFRLQRQGDNYAQQPLNVFINKKYHASLYPEHQAVGLSLCPGKSSLVVVPGNRKEGIVGYEQNVEVLTPQLLAGTTYFYQIVVDSAGKGEGRWVDSEQAKSVLANINIQTHTISRVYEDEKCPSGIYTINASALFKLGKYNEQGLLPGAVENLKTLTGTIISDYKTITKIIVNGHADPMGSPENNWLLSERRANTVVAQLITAELPSKSIFAHGMGSSSPVVADCRKYKKRNDVIECNQPNRRVEIEVYGVRRDGEG